MEWMFFDDEGNPINPSSIPRPKLCWTCARNLMLSEQVLCQLNRLDQINAPTFECAAYQPLGEGLTGN